MKQPYRAMFWFMLPYAAWTVVACLWWAAPVPAGDHAAGLAKLAPLALTILLGLPGSLLLSLLGWALGVHSDNGLFACLVLGGWLQYMALGWFVGRGIVRQQVLNSLHGPTLPGTPEPDVTPKRSSSQDPPASV